MISVDFDHIDGVGELIRNSVRGGGGLLLDHARHRWAPSLSVFWFKGMSKKRRGRESDKTKIDTV